MISQLSVGLVGVVGIAVGGVVREVVEPEDFVFEDKAEQVDDEKYPSAENAEQHCDDHSEKVVFLRTLCKTIEICGDVPKKTKNYLYPFFKVFVSFDIVCQKFFHITPLFDEAVIAPRDFSRQGFYAKRTKIIAFSNKIKVELLKINLVNYLY